MFLFKDTDFSMFTMHMFPGIVIVSLVSYGVMRLFYTKVDSLENQDPSEVAGALDTIMCYIS